MLAVVAHRSVTATRPSATIVALEILAKIRVPGSMLREFRIFKCVTERALGNRYSLPVAWMIADIRRTLVIAIRNQ
jgi:hypothetical protein